MNTSAALPLPAFAPLPSSMVLHLAAREFPARFDITPETLNTVVQNYIQTQRREYSDIYQRLIDILHVLLEKVRVAREYIYQNMRVARASNQLDQNWLQTSMSSILNEKSEHPGGRHYSVSSQAITNFRRRNILPGPPRSFVADRAAALLCCAMIDSRQQGIAPHMIAREEPYYWLYGQTHPEAPIRAYPYPWPPTPLQQPASVPATTLLWSPWPTMEGLLTTFGSLGSMAFADASAITLQDLKLWNPAIADKRRALIWGLPRENDVDTYIEQTLQEYALRYLNPDRIPDKLIHSF